MEILSLLAQRYPKITLSEERQLILKAQKGSKKSKDELVLCHVGFLIFRIHKIAFPEFIKRFEQFYTVRMSNYPVQDVYLPRGRRIETEVFT